MLHPADQIIIIQPFTQRESATLLAQEGEHHRTILIVMSEWGLVMYMVAIKHAMFHIAKQNVLVSFPACFGRRNNRDTFWTRPHSIQEEMYVDLPLLYSLRWACCMQSEHTRASGVPLYEAVLRFFPPFFHLKILTELNLWFWGLCVMMKSLLFSFTFIFFCGYKSLSS